MPAKDAGRGLSADAFASLLSRLGPDTERAGRVYEDLRRALVSFFAWRGAATPEECADESLDRLAARIDEGVAVEDVPRFALGIARLVLLEHWRRPGARHVPLDELPREPKAPEPPDDDARARSLAGCLDELPAESRSLILDYYGGDGRGRIDRRKGMAERLGISENALRSRAQRVRDQLESCVRRRLVSALDGTKS
jgi:DNA-directed RNA polymerase specialized sigma24 family protein